MAKAERTRKYTCNWIEINKEHFRTGSNKKKILMDLKVFKTVSFIVFALGFLLFLCLIYFSLSFLLLWSTLIHIHTCFYTLQ